MIIVRFPLTPLEVNDLFRFNEDLVVNLYYFYENIQNKFKLDEWHRIFLHLTGSEMKTVLLGGSSMDAICSLLVILPHHHNMKMKNILKMQPTNKAFHDFGNISLSINHKYEILYSLQ